MTPLRFRAWHKIKRQWQDIVYIDFLTGNVGVIVVVENQNTGEAEQEEELWNKEDVIIVQSTGLKDKNGEEIFEGGIVRFKYYGNVFIVDVRYVNFGYLPFRDIDEKNAIGGIENEVCEVIGNIYQDSHLLENPELLTK